MKKIAICFSLLLAQAWGLSCTTPVTISEPGRDVSSPTVTINEEGEVLALWVSENPDEKTETVMAATKDHEKKWSAAAISEPAQEIGDLNSMTDHQGSHFVSWKLKKKDLEGEKLKFFQFAKKEKNKDWSRAVNVISPEDQLKYPESAFDSQGNGLFFCCQASQGLFKHNVVSVFYSHQKDEVEKTDIGEKDGVTAAQYLVKNRSGKVFAGWEEGSYKDSMPVKRLQGAWLEKDGKWSDPTTLFSFSDNPYTSGEGGVMNSKGDMAILWSLSPQVGEDKTLQVIAYFDGLWSEPFDLAVSKHYFYRKKLAMSESGHIVVSWTQSEKDKEVIYVADKAPGQPWSSPIALVEVEEAESPKISIDEQGNILVAWTVEEGRKEVPYAAYKPVNQAWEAPVRLSSGARECSSLKVRPNHQGSFIVLWNEFQRKQVSIRGASLPTATKEWSFATISPEGQDCGNFKFAFNKKGQGIIVWTTTWDVEDPFIQVAELNVN
ncbi:MAG TPA: hypothetical protein VFU89_07485 [Rhabdochlamydiaceae bacterium]|nr:hypothetical protein [Rhabdochlamydiaceae bacterium]